jgi:RNA polymerase sigma-70 factor (ECF subfamily)
MVDDMGALMARARQGDREALEAVLETVAPSIHRFGLRMCKNAHDADDVLQDTLINVAEHLGDFEGRSSFSSWVFALTRSACARRRRGLKNRPPMDDDGATQRPDTAPNPESRTAEKEMAEALSRALDGLPSDYREVILLRDIEGLSAPEAATSLGISVDALKSRLHRARESLREALRPLLEPSQTRTPSGCPDVVDLWSKKLEGDLSQDDCHAMEAHLEGCPTCGAACDALREALLACQRVRTDAVPPAIREQVREAVRTMVERSGAAGRMLEPIGAPTGSHPRRRA